MKIILDGNAFECNKFVVLDKFGNAVAAGYDHEGVLVFDTCVGPEFPKILSIVGHEKNCPLEIVHAESYYPKLTDTPPVLIKTQQKNHDRDHGWTTSSF